MLLTVTPFHDFSINQATYAAHPAQRNLVQYFISLLLPVRAHPGPFWRPSHSTLGALLQRLQYSGVMYSEQDTIYKPHLRWI